MYHGELVKLRALEMEDLDIILKHFNNLELRQYLATAWPMSRNAERQWLERATTMNPWKDGEFILAIEDKKTNEFLGSVSLFDISKQHQRAEFGIAIHNPDNLGKGYGTDTTKVMLWVAFHVLGLNTVFLLTLDSNKRAQRAYEKAGFKYAGIFRQGSYMLGKFHDFVIMDVTKDDFMEQFPPGSEVGQP
ncbi:N-acetyltransferase [Candidatus Thorarchaeota archaeon]|nr:MAG: N-acetyltransferase [Candidatus Thorarchaeota archaeon]